MSTTVEDVEAQALKLSAEDRAELIERLITTVVPHPPLHPAWEAEIARRIDDLDAGRTKLIPGDQVFAEIRAVIEAHERKP